VNPSSGPTRQEDLVGTGDRVVLPLAIGVALSPVPIIAVMLMLTTAKACANGAMFIKLTRDHVPLSDGTSTKSRLVVWGGGEMAASLAAVQELLGPAMAAAPESTGVVADGVSGLISGGGWPRAPSAGWCPDSRPTYRRRACRAARTPWAGSRQTFS
jgi:hypothetical protein